jgi:hypothetical protein
MNAATEDAPRLPGRPSWLGVAVPLAAAAAVALVVALLASVVQLDRAVVPKPAFRQHLLPGYPDQVPLADAVLMVDATLWWLCLSVVSWVAGLCVLGLCVVQLHRATRHDAALHRLALGALLSVVAVAGVALAALVLQRDMALMPVRPLVEILDVIGAGLPRLASLNTALAYVVGLALAATASLLLAPGVCTGAPGLQMRAITLLMYGAALFLLVWIATANGMYRLAATLLVPAVRDPVLMVAPTISLMGGLFLSLLLATVYTSSAAWLQHCHEQAAPGSGSAAHANDRASPLAFLAVHWPKVVGVLLPSLPGIVGSVAQTLVQVH